MTNINEQMTNLVVSQKDGKMVTQVITDQKFGQLQEANPNQIVIRSRADLKQLITEYEDIPVENGAVLYPELNTLFAYLLRCLVDVEGEGSPLPRQILLNIDLQRKKEVI